MMTRRSVLAGLLVAASAGVSSAEEPAIFGIWSGAIDAGSQRLRLKLRIDPDGSATLYSIDQGGQPIATRVLSLAPTRVEFEVPAVSGRFVGSQSHSDRIEGVWRQSAAEIPLTFERGEVVLPARSPAEPLTQQRLMRLRADAGSPALAAAAVRRDGPVQMWVDGERAVGTGIAVLESDKWHFGSIGKSLTATLIGRLVEMGEVAWDDTVGGTLTTVAPDMRDAYKLVTLRHLLSHRSGMPANIPDAELAAVSAIGIDPREQRNSYLRRALAMPLSGRMEERFEYSNSGYVVAGAMLEAKLGQRWEVLMRQHVFEPLKLRSAGFGAPGRPQVIEQPAGHAKEPDNEQRRVYLPGQGSTDNPVALGPAGRVHMSLRDMITYLVAHRDRSAFLKPTTWSMLHTPPFGGDYAMGWFIRPSGVFWHNGSNTLWYAEVQFDPANGVVAAAVCNDGHIGKSSFSVGRALVEAAAAV